MTLRAFASGAAIGAALCGWAVSAAAQSGQPASSRATPPRLGLADCVNLALARSSEIRTDDLGVEQARASRSAAAGRFGPLLHADGVVQQWDSPYDILFQLTPGGPPTTFPVRDAFTWTAGVTLSQPLTTLFQIYAEYKVQDLGIDVAALARAAGRRDVAFAVTRAYYRVLEASRLFGVAQASVTSLEAQERQARSLFVNGVIGKNDLLRAALAVASAKQRAIEAGGQVTIASGDLAVAVGLSPEEPLAIVDDARDPAAFDETAVAMAEERAITGRIELRALDRRIAQAGSAKSAAASRLAPDIRVVGNYTHTAGQPFQKVDAEYVGLLGSWDVWDWGTTLSGIRIADAQLAQARVARRKLEDQIRLEARQAYVSAGNVASAFQVARASVSQAEENFRIVTKRFENNAATSFDVVDAESLLTDARARLETARYESVIAEAALARATGAPLAGQP